MSFRDPRLSPPCLPMWAAQVRVEAGFSKQCLPVALSPSPLSSCHSDPLPEPHCSSDLTSSGHFLPSAWTLLTLPRHRWRTSTASLWETSAQLGQFFFFFMKWCLRGWVQMSARPEHTSDNKIGILLGKYLHCLHPSVLSYELHVILRFSNVICVTDFQT